jgi:hypothetical protein
MSQELKILGAADASTATDLPDWAMVQILKNTIADLEADIDRLQAEAGALQQRLNVADEQVDILSGGLRLMTSFGSGTNIAGVKTVAKQTLNRAAGVASKPEPTTPQ